MLIRRVLKRGGLEAGLVDEGAQSRIRRGVIRRGGLDRALTVFDFCVSFFGHMVHVLEESACLLIMLTSFDHYTRLLSYEETVLHPGDQDLVQTRASPVTAEKMTWQLCCGKETKWL